MYGRKLLFPMCYFILNRKGVWGLLSEVEAILGRTTPGYEPLTELFPGHIISGHAEFFTASTKFKDIKVLPDRIEILVKHDCKRLFLFGTSESKVLSLPHRSF
jgi:hypothetical protein